jgi:hypothetical protein
MPGLFRDIRILPLIKTVEGVYMLLNQGVADNFHTSKNTVYLLFLESFRNI